MAILDNAWLINCVYKKKPSCILILITSILIKVLILDVLCRLRCALTSKGQQAQNSTTSNGSVVTSSDDSSLATKVSSCISQ